MILGSGWTWIAAALVVGFSPAAALADEPSVEVMAEVVLASTQGEVIDPPSLASMKAAFAEKTRYSSFKRLSSEKVVVSKKATELRLANNKKATLRLEEIKDGTAKLSVSIPPLKEVVYTLGREGSLYVASGSYGRGDLWLVLSAVEAAKPRRSPPHAHPASPVVPK